MPSLLHMIAFGLVATGMVLSPGPNMMYLVSRAITQGRVAALISMGGVFVGFIFYLLCAALGITALVMAVPYAYDTLRIAGACYLAWLAWNALKPGGRSAFEVIELPKDSPRKLFLMGLFTNLLNPKAAVLYLSLLPQFIEPAAGPVFTQALALGFIQIAISMLGNGVIAMTAGTIAVFLRTRPSFAKMQRWLMGTVLAALALRMAVESSR